MDDKTYDELMEQILAKAEQEIDRYNSEIDKAEAAERAKKEAAQKLEEEKKRREEALLQDVKSKEIDIGGLAEF